MNFGIDSIMDTFEIGFDSKKIFFQLSGVIIALLGFFVFSWLGSGIKNLEILFNILGGIWLYMVLVLTHGGTCRMFYVELSSREKPSLPQTIKFVKDRALSLIGSPLLLLLSMALILVAEFASVWLLGKIPALGEILNALLCLPLFALNALIALLLLFGTALAMAIIAVDEFKAADTVKRIFEVVKKSPIYLILYYSFATLFLLLVILGVLITYFISLSLTSGIFWPITSALASGTFLATSLSSKIAVILLFVVLAFISALVFSYILVAIQGINTAIYLSIKERIK